MVVLFMKSEWGNRVICPALLQVTKTIVDAQVAVVAA
jgi:hypothetical protein